MNGNLKFFHDQKHWHKQRRIELLNLLPNKLNAEEFWREFKALGDKEIGKAPLSSITKCLF